jgi:transcriptional regulator with XRE-family HTH domain
MNGASEKIGAFIRREREGKEIGLREMAKMIGVSPTYLSKIERDEFPPPAEDKVRAIAKIIRCDVDELLARAGRVSSDITDIIKRRPVELTLLVRITNGLTTSEITVLVKNAQNAKSWGADYGADDADEEGRPDAEKSARPLQGADRTRRC